MLQFYKSILIMRVSNIWYQIYKDYQFVIYTVIKNIGKFIVKDLIIWRRVNGRILRNLYFGSCYDESKFLSIFDTKIKCNWKVGRWYIDMN